MARRGGRTRTPKEPTRYFEASEVKAIAEELIEQYHPHLQDEPLDYWFRSPAATGKGGRIRPARIVPRGAFDAQVRGGEWAKKGRYYVLEVARTVWSRMTTEAQKALVDHYLCRLVAGKNALMIIEPDVVEFAAVAKRHGAWDDSLRGIVQALEAHDVSPQTAMDLEGEAPIEPTAEAPAEATATANPEHEAALEAAGDKLLEQAEDTSEGRRTEPATEDKPRSRRRAAPGDQLAA